MVNKTDARRKAGISACRKRCVGATRGRPRILLSKIHRCKAKNTVIFLWKTRKTKFFGGRPRVAPTFSDGKTFFDILDARRKAGIFT